MARIKARIKPRPVVAQSRSDEKLKRAEARALVAEAEEREFARKDAAEVDALRTTQEEQARNRQEAASKKESEYKDAVDALRRESLARIEQYAKECEDADEAEAKVFADELEEFDKNWGSSEVPDSQEDEGE